MKRTLIIWLPAILGFLLIFVVNVDLYQFNKGAIDARTMLFREMPIVFGGMLLGLLIFLNSFNWLFKKKWCVALQSIISPAIFLILFGLGGALGGAFLNAT